MTDDAPHDALHFSGVDGSTGGYLHPELTLADAVDAVAPSREGHEAELALRRRSSQQSFGVRRQERADDLSHAGWALVVPEGTPRAVTAALAPLCERRASRPGTVTGASTCLGRIPRPSFSDATEWGRGLQTPTRVPYYLLSSAPRIASPLRFQYELDVQYAVGRVSFETAEYGCYADSVARAEDSHDARRSVCLLGRPTRVTGRRSWPSQLLAPLETELRSEADGWDVDAIVGAGAVKKRLAALLFGDAAPALLVTAGHGLGFLAGDPLRHDAQGALLCADWRGPPRRRPCRPRHLPERRRRT